MAGQSNQDIACVPLQGPKQWAAYHRFRRRLYAQDPAWVEPLHSGLQAKWRSDHPWFSHAKAACWVAYRDGEMVGSISAQIDAWAAPQSKLGYFGQFECIDDGRVAEVLLQQAKQWLSSHGMQKMRGPFDLHINDTTGLLVDGFDTPPKMMMPHHPKYYADLLASLGLVPVMRLYAYAIAPDFEAPKAMKRLCQRHAHRLSISPLNPRRYAEEIELMRSLFNDAWQTNWGFVPFSVDEFQAIGDELKPILNPRYTAIARLDDAPVGFLVALPNINELITGFNGRLLPWNVVRLLWRLRTKSYRSARVPLMGVKSDFHQGPLGAMIAFSMIDAVRWPLHEDAVSDVEMSWVLETNQGMNALIQSMGGNPYKTYALFECSLPANFS